MTPPTGYTCEVKKDNCGLDFCCCTKNTCVPNYSTTCAAPSTPKTGACTAADAGCTTKKDNCGNDFCCCAGGGGTCSTGTAFGVPNQCAAGTVCDKTLYPTVTTLGDKGCGRWGWIIDTGALTGSVSYRLWTGAGQNDLKKGSLAGSVSIQPCSAGSSSWCAVFSTTSGYALTSAHVEADCDALSTRTSNNFPCAPGGYNDNGGNSSAPTAFPALRGLASRSPAAPPNTITSSSTPPCPALQVAPVPTAEIRILVREGSSIPRSLEWLQSK